ncbi:three component ABC system middle component [Pseudomonas baetica]|uniref:three component ABC system middle component n=1 Tax=Pseudomonas baetica TaxID=674054 RepID=UPI0024070AEF|nr:three component ABC system middle component [Pseudomonas baetica]MDF9773648.1 hypothetical protein [Pseudomonas baetica]
MNEAESHDLSESQIVYNTPLGGFLLSNFAKKYELFSGHDRIPFTLLFLVLPLLYHGETREVLKSTQAGSGLRIFASKLNKTRSPTFMIQDRAVGFRGLSLTCVSAAIDMGFIRLFPETAEVCCVDFDYSDAPIELIAELVKCAEKLGRWFAEVDIRELTKLLKVLL